MRRPPLLLGMMAGAAALGMAVNIGAAASPPGHAPKSASTPASVPPKSRMGAMLADDIAQREKQQGAETRALDLREQAAKAAQARLTAALKAQQQLAAQNAAPESQTTGGRAAGKGAPSDAPDPYDALARIYQAMKPARAAPVFEQLDLEVQTLVAKRMRDRSAALLMAAMSPGAAARLSMALAGRRPRAEPPTTIAPPPK